MNTVQEAYELRRELEADILSLCVAFTNETTLKVTDIDTHHFKLGDVARVVVTATL